MSEREKKNILRILCGFVFGGIIMLIIGYFEYIPLMIPAGALFAGGIIGFIYFLISTKQKMLTSIKSIIKF